MDDLWRRVMALKGQILQTVRGERFTIDRVDRTNVWVVPASSGKPRQVARIDLDRALPLMSPGRELRPSEIKARLPNLRNHSYVAALINRLAQSS